jgi:hypothetical protein
MQNISLAIIEMEHEMEQRSSDKRRHWSSLSQTYAPADILLDYLADGWAISPVVGQKETWHGGGRHIVIYYFEITKNDQVLTIPVLGNPVVHRLVYERHLQTVWLTG